MDEQDAPPSFGNSPMVEDSDEDDFAGASLARPRVHPRAACFLARSRGTGKHDSGAFGARVTYILILGATLALLHLRDTDLHAAVDARDWGQVATFYSTVVGGILLYVWASVRDPGAVSARDVELGTRKPTVTPADSGTEVRRLVTADRQPERHYCRYCMLEQPLRCRHCHDCGHCVAKFDHHCFWLGNCVGAGNHHIFVLFLGVQSAAVVWGFWYACSGLEYVDSKSAGTWFAHNGLMLVLVVVLFCMVWLPTLLFVFHVFLMLTNQTTWEVSRFERISYLDGLPDGALPFSRGVCGNVREFCAGRVVEYSVPESAYHTASARQCWICNNEYYECF